MTTDSFDVQAIRQALTPFQRRTVDHIMDRFSGPNPGTRFLVADETGLGKSLVARGVIARTIEQLEEDPEIKRIDIIYVCSNTDLAQQNLARLNVTGVDGVALASRLTLLAKQSGRLSGKAPRGRKPVNLISFTPGTSFDHGQKGGKGEERAMLHIALMAALEQKGDLPLRRRNASLRVFQGTVTSWQRFRDNYVNVLQAELRTEAADQRILRRFSKEIAKRPGLGEDQRTLLERFEGLLDRLEGAQLNARLRDEAWRLTGELRAALARSGVETLEPDLVILDEFQRFRDLLDPATDQGELAHALFEHPHAKVLLLSATPFKAFTFAEEDENHAKDFLRTLSFLGAGASSSNFDISAVQAGFAAIREAARRGTVPDVALQDLSDQLRLVMSRWERPSLFVDTMHAERLDPAEDVRAEDLAGYASLTAVANTVGRQKDSRLVVPEYWKSAPYFINFSAGYQLGNRLVYDHAGVALTSWPSKVSKLLQTTQSIDAQALRTFTPLDSGNARMRVLASQTVGADWWRFLWMPPSLPYLVPGGVYASAAAASMTKRLVFSSWAATPAAVASILSYEAERRMAEGTNYEEYSPEARRKLTQSLVYSISNDRPANMTTLLVMWPLTRLASLADVRVMVAANHGRPVTAAQARRQVRKLLSEHYSSHVRRTTDVTTSGRDVVWRTVFNDPDNWAEIDMSGSPEQVPEDLWQIVDSLSDSRDDEAESTESSEEAQTALDRHFIHALESHQLGPVGPAGKDVDLLVRVALFAPGCVSLRVLTRLVEAAHSSQAVTTLGLHVAAAALANGLRRLFNRPDVSKLLDGTPYRGPYWTRMLQYIEHGNLEAVLDEWLYHYWADHGRQALDDDRLQAMVDAAQGAISIRTVTYHALNTRDPKDDLKFSGSFALRYGSRTLRQEDARQPEVRAAFNSPFWPFVLASTSIGQEGLDFHWWCHAVFHWNTPPNPVDFEQREGRVDRYRGHAVRRNIAAAHAEQILADGAGNPWAIAYTHANGNADGGLGFAPDWVYPGPAKIERHVAPMLCSNDRAHYERVKQDVAFYRLALGQPRQEDMLAIVRDAGLDPMALRIDLRP